MAFYDPSPCPLHEGENSCSLPFGEGWGGVVNDHFFPNTAFLVFKPSIIIENLVIYFYLTFYTKNE